MKKTKTSLEAAQLRKMRLEIETLRQQKKWATVSVFIPVITTAVTVLGLVLGVWQIQRGQTLARVEQENERINKIQNQIRADKDQILEFVTNDKISSVRVAFLIDDLNSLIQQLPQPESQKESVTELLRGVIWDLPFDKERHFGFDVSALRRWKDYREFWKLNLNSHRDFLSSKYHTRLEQLHAQNKSCIENLNYEEGTTTLTYKGAGQNCPEELINAFIYGFAEHLKVISESPESELLGKELEELSSRSNNAVLAKKLAAIYFPPKKSN